MSLDLEALKKAAQAATQGDWHLGKRGMGVVTGGPIVEFARGSAQQQIAMFCSHEWMRDDERDANAEFCVSARPDVVLELIARIEKAEDALRTAEDALANCYDVTAYPGKEFCPQGDALDVVRDALNGSHVVIATCPKCFECFDPTSGEQTADAAEFAKLQTHLNAHHKDARPSAPAGLAAWALAALKGAELARTEQPNT